jgi:predicted RNase H-like HicB family nuclease
MPHFEHLAKAQLRQPEASVSIDVAQAADIGKTLQSVYESLKELTLAIGRIELRLQDRQSNAVISTFSPEPYVLKLSIPVHIRSVDESFIATFFDANISTSGETEEEAFSNLKSLIVETFDYLDLVDPEHLGPEPLRQLEVLREFMSSTQ